jgi:hypothetical protein
VVSLSSSFPALSGPLWRLQTPQWFSYLLGVETAVAGGRDQVQATLTKVTNTLSTLETGLDPLHCQEATGPKPPGGELSGQQTALLPLPD